MTKRRPEDRFHQRMDDARKEGRSLWDELMSPQGMVDFEMKRKTEQLLPHVAARMGITEAELDQRMVGFGMYDFADEPLCNGFSSSKDNWRTFEIGIGRPMTRLLHRMNKLFMSLVNLHVVDDEGGITDQTSSKGRSSEEIGEEVTRQLSAYWEGRFEEIGSLVRAEDLSEAQLTLAAQLLHFAEMFVMAHEFGHVIVNSKQRNVPEYAHGDNVVRQILSRTSTELAQNEKLVARWAEELAADLLGIQITLACVPSGMLRLLAFSAVEMVILIDMLLTQFHTKYYGRPIEDTTHPPAMLRLQMLRSTAADYQQWSGDGMYLGTFFESTVQNWIEQL